MFTGKERGDLQMSAEGLHPFDGPGYVVSLLRLELQGGDLEPVAVKGAILVCDQDNVLESVDVDEKMKLSRYRVRFAIQGEMASHARGAPGNCQPVIPWQIQRMAHEVIELLSKSTITAINGGIMNSTVIEGDLALENISSEIFRHQRILEECRRAGGSSGDQSVAFQKLVVAENHFSSGVGAQTTAVENDDTVRQFADQAQVMRGEDESSREISEDVTQLSPTSRVKIGEGFIQGQASGAAGQNPSQAGSFAFPERKPCRVPFGESLEFDVDQCLGDPGLDFVGIEIQVERAESDVPANGGSKKLVGRILEKDTDSSADFCGVFGGGRQVVYGDGGERLR